MTFLLGNSGFIWYIPVIAAILFIIIWKNFVGKRSPRKDRLLFFLSRTAIVALLIISLANPFVIESKVVPGDPKVTFLADNSKSMDIFEYDLNKLVDDLSKQIPVSRSQIAFEESSAIGDSILNNIERNSNLLLYTDGRVTSGSTLDKIANVLLDLNVTVNILDIIPSKNDASVSIFGPSETVLNVENNFLINLDKFGIDKVPLKVTIDDDVVYNGMADGNVKIPRIFTRNGHHRIQAEIDVDDHFKENNIFYKTIKVIEKPKILYISKTTKPIENILNQLYDVDKMPVIPNNLDQYYAVVINDMQTSDINNINTLQRFLIDNNGLFVIGGFRSFENGGYKDSDFIQLLPVDIGSGTPDRGGVNLVILIDISGSTGQLFGTETKVNIQKALALSAINNLRLNNKVGILAFNTEAHLVSNIQPLISNRESLQDKVSRLKDFGGTSMDIGLSAAYQMINKLSGSKYIIVISDGQTTNKAKTLDIASVVSSEGINIISVGVGGDTDVDFMQELARRGKGFYLQPTENDRLKVLFGDIVESGGDRFGLTIIDGNHFITNEMKLSATLDDFNQVVPKPQASLLVTTDSGRAALTAWRFGLGRVAALTVFSSTDTLGQLLNKENSQLISRTINWNIGNPERKKDTYIKIKDARLGEKASILLKSQSIPNSDLDLTRISEDKYAAEIEANETGFNSILNGIYATSYKREYEDLGVSSQITALVDITGGKSFDIKQVDDIVKHVRESSKRLESTKQSLIIYFILPMILIFLIEASIRRWKGAIR